MKDQAVHSIGARLKVWREAKSLKQADAADLLQLPRNTYQNYERDVRSPHTEAWLAFAQAGINANWLLTGEGDMFLSKAVPADEPTSVEYGSNHKSSKGLRVHESPKATYSTDPEDGYVAIPLYDDVSAAAGHGSVVGHELPASGMLMFQEAWVRYELQAKPTDLCLINVRGHSMEPTLRAGDIILIDLRAKFPDCEGIYLLRVEGMLLVKNLQILPGAILRVTSDNPTFEPFTINLSDTNNDLEILGRVVWGGRRF